MPAVYVASPLGFSAATRPYIAELLDSVRGAGLDALDPWADADAPAEFEAAAALPPGPDRLDAFRAVNARLGAANAAMIKRADGVLALLDGTDVDSGTAAEIGFAAALGKPVVGLRLDTRLSGDNEGAVVNLQVEHFIALRGGRVVRERDAAVAALADLVRAGAA